MSDEEEGCTIKYIPIDKKRWFDLMEGRKKKDIMLSGKYVEMLKKLPEDQQTKTEGKYLRGEIKTWSEMMVSDSELIRKAKTEHLYNVYCLDVCAGLPSLMGCTEDEYRKLYDNNDAIKRPTYVI